MNKLDKTKSLIEKALVAVQFEIDRSSSIPMKQLLLFRQKLISISQEVESGSLPPKALRDVGMARAVVDSWPLTLATGDASVVATGEAIVATERAYIEL